MAIDHFNNFYKNVGYPISLSRGAYWLGRSYEKIGDNNKSQEWYEEATKYLTTYYGQLSHLKISPDKPFVLNDLMEVDKNIAEKFYIKDFVKILKNNKFTVITAVNTLFNLLLNSSNFKKLDFSNLKFSVGGGMSVLSSTASKWKSVTGVEITHGYGLTETSPIVSINKIKDAYNGTIGLPVPSTDISIRNDNGEELSIDQEGELCIKGPQVMTGYYNNIQETEKSFTDDGFFKTGDIATVNSEGFIKIVDRKKDMII